MIDRRQSPVTGRVVWRVRWYEMKPTGGRRERSRTFTTKREALDFDRERAQARRMGVVSSGRVPVSEVAERYFANLNGTLTSRTVYGYRQHWRTHLAPTFGHLRVEDVTPPRIQEFVSALAARRSPATTRKVHRTLSLILDQAVAERRLFANPARGVRLPRMPAQLGDHVMTIEQVESLAHAVRRDPILVRVAAYCGLRWGEVAALEVGDIDLPARRIRVQRAQVEVSGRIEIKDPKSRHGQRRVPIPARLVGELQSLTAGRAPSEVLFTSPRGGRLRATNWKLWAGWRDAVQSIGGGFRFHDLRHTCASLLIQAGATPVEVQRILGHSTPATTLNLYTHLMPDALDGAAAKLDGYLDSRP